MIKLLESLNKINAWVGFWRNSSIEILSVFIVVVLILFCAVLARDLYFQICDSEKKCFCVFADILFIFSIGILNSVFVESSYSSSRVLQFTPFMPVLFILPVIAELLWSYYLKEKGIAESRSDSRVSEGKEPVFAGTESKQLKMSALFLDLSYWKSHIIVSGVLGLSVVLQIFASVIAYHYLVNIYSFIYFLDGLFVSMMVIQALQNSWNFHITFAVVNIFAKVCLFANDFKNITPGIFCFYFLFPIILALPMYGMMQLKLGKYKKYIIIGAAASVDLLVLPLILNIRVIGYGNISFFDIVFTSRELYRLLALSIPLLIYILKPEIFSKNSVELLEGDMKTKLQSSEKKLQTYTEMKKIDLAIRDLEKKNSMLYKSLGQKVFESGIGNDEINHEITARIVMLQNQNQKLRAGIEALKGTRSCPRCGKKIPSEHMFCMYCGQQLSEAQQNMENIVDVVQMNASENTETEGNENE